MILALALSPGPAAALDDVVMEAARALLATYHEDPAKLDRARDALTASVQRDPQPATLALLARTWFLIGDQGRRGAVEAPISLDLAL